MKKKLFLMMIAAAAIIFAGCSKDDDPNNSDNTVPDPAGTLSANITESTSASLDGMYVAWYPPNNLWLHTSYGGPNFYTNFSICDMGKVNGLGAITTIPTIGYTEEVNVQTKTMPCELGHGYVIKVRWWMTSGEIYYVRLYVSELIENNNGTLIGAKVKYQYPFNP
jgi:hypothetical protein